MTYQPCAQIGNLCNRYVVVTYRSIIYTTSKEHVSNTSNFGQLIQIGAEQLRNKPIVIYFRYCMFIILIGATYITNLTKYYIKPLSQMTCLVISNQD